MGSIWQENIINEYPKLEKDISVDVLIIGGGISGILCAYELKKRNINCVVVEKNRIGKHTSKDTTAFLSIHHEELYQDLIKSIGKEKAKEYLRLNVDAINRYKELANSYDFCFEEVSGCIFTNESSNKIYKEKEVLSSLGIESEIIKDLPINLAIKEGLKVNVGATIDPLKLINELSKDLTIYEHSEVIKLVGKEALLSNNKKIKFSKVVICTHYPIHNIKNLYFPKITQRRSYVVAFKNRDVKDMYTSIDDKGLYFRRYKDYVIVGGNDRDTKDTCIHNFEKRIKELLKIKKVDYSWSGQDCMTLDNVPYIGRFNIFRDDYFVVTGFNLWGYTWAMASSIIIADLIEKKKEYPLVNPLRIVINMKLLENILTSIKNLVTFRKPRCKHLGCALYFNKEENVYECPCHGSRYDKSGNVINEPSEKNLKIE